MITFKSLNLKVIIMKKILLFIAFLIGNHSFGQLSLEHTYPQAPVQRIKLEQSGEKYSSYMPDKTMALYNADHSLWKSVVLGIPSDTPAQSVGVHHISESVFNNDANVEVMYTYYHSPSNGFSVTSKIIADNGTVLFELPGCNFLSLSRFEGIPDRLIAQMSDGTSRIYDVNLNLLNTFEFPVKRIQLELSGEKYYAFDKENDRVVFFNNDYTSWKQVALIKPSGSTYSSIHFISETIKPDAQLEIGYDCFSGSNVESRIVDENGDLLLSGTNIGLMRISKIDGLPTKLIASGMLYTEGFPQVTNVYSLPDLTLEHHFDEWLERHKFQNSGEKYYNLLAVENTVKIYSSDYSLWKTIPLEFQESRTATHVTHISESIINDDALIEVAVASDLNLILEPYPQTIVVNETGEVLAVLQNIYGLQLSEIPGLNNKFIGRGMFVDQQNFGQVYALEALNTVHFDKGKVVVYPNPVHSLLNVRSENARIVEAGLYNMLGLLVWSESSASIEKIEMGSFQSGTYLLQLTTADGAKTNRKIIVTK